MKVTNILRQLAPSAEQFAPPMPHLFTYGSLMFPEVWRIVVGKQFETRPAQLRDYQIFRVASALYPGIVAIDLPQASVLRPLHSTAVPGLLYLNVDAASLDRLDRFEGDDYRRLTVEVAAPGGQAITADTYVIPPEHRHLLTDEIWTAEEFAANGHLERFIAKFGGFDRID